jgi:LysM repeat protein
MRPARVRAWRCAIFTAMKTFFVYAIVSMVLLLTACERRGVQVRRVLERAAALSEAEQYQDAARLYQKALALDPTCEEAALQIALIFDDCLKDKSNAVVAYEHYLNIARNPAARAQAVQWLASARQAGGAAAPSAAPAPAPVPDAAKLQLAQTLALKDQQFEEVRRQLVERYETQLRALHDELAAQQERTRQRERTLALDPAVTNAGYVPELLARLASNEFVIATLQEQLAQQQQTAAAPPRELQTQVAELRRKLEYAEAQARLGESYIASNVALTLACATLSRNLAAREARGVDATTLIASADTNGMSALQRTLASYTRTATDEHDVLPDDVRKLQQQYQTLRQKYLDEIESRRTPGAITARPGVTLAGASRSLPGATPPNVRVPATTAAPRGGTTRPASTTLEPMTLAMAEARHAAPRRAYTVQAGDSLMKIARDVYGDASLWTKLFYENRDTLDRPNQLRVGQVLRVP